MKEYIKRILMVSIIAGCISHPCFADRDIPGPAENGVAEKSDTQMKSLKKNIPVADAGRDQYVRPNDLVFMNGSNSYGFAEQKQLKYVWTLISMPEKGRAVFTHPNSVKPTFKSETVGDYVFELIVSDVIGRISESDQMTVHIYNTPPVADAGLDQPLVETGTTVHLDGTGSYDKDGDALHYLWAMKKKPSGSNAKLSDPKTALPSFSADVRGDYIVELTVSDPWIKSSPDTVTMSFGNVKPVARAGDDQTIAVGDSSYLDGTGSSDANADQLTYQWGVVESPKNSRPELSNPLSEDTNFVTDLPGRYIIRLVVNDGAADSDPDDVVISVLSNKDYIAYNLNKIIDILNSLDDETFKSNRLRDDLVRTVKLTLDFVKIENYPIVLYSLETNVLAKINGCAETKGPDILPESDHDWIVTCEAQQRIYTVVSDTVDLLREMLF